MERPLPVLVNVGGGTAASHGERLRDEIARAFAAAGREIELRLLAGGELAEAARTLADRPALVVGGGDGTLNGAAAAMLEARSKAALGILPLGTHNHLARDLGIPADLGEAARIAVGDAVSRIDVARVNDRIFLNNASIGLYPALVQRREAVRRRHGHGPKWLADLPAAWAVLKRARHHRLRLAIEGERTELRTPMLFVGNNLYAIEPGQFGRRASLQDGLLSVYALKHSSRVGLLGLALRTALGRTDPERDLAAVAETAAFEVRLHRASIEIALDGEVARLDGPLRFAVEPGVLTVLTPSP